MRRAVLVASIGFGLACAVCAPSCRSNRRGISDSDAYRAKCFTSILGRLLCVSQMMTSEELPALSKKTPVGHLVGWRLKVVLQSITSLPVGEPRPAVTPWNDPSFRPLDDDSCHQFCLSRDAASLERERRFTRIMAIDDADSAYNRIRHSDYDEIEAIAPDAILIVEVSFSDVPWMAAGDLNLQELPSNFEHNGVLGIGSNSDDGSFAVGFVDGTVFIMRKDTPFERLEKFLTVEGVQGFDRDQELGDYVLHKISPDRG